MSATIDIITEAVQDAVRGYDVQAVYLFGSYARGEAIEASDVDLRLECGPSMTFGMLYRIQQQLETRLGCNVDIVTCRLEHMRPRFRNRVQRDEVLLYGAA